MYFCISTQVVFAKISEQTTSNLRSAQLCRIRLLRFLRSEIVSIKSLRIGFKKCFPWRWVGCFDSSVNLESADFWSQVFNLWWRYSWPNRGPCLLPLLFNRYRGRWDCEITCYDIVWNLCIHHNTFTVSVWLASSLSLKCILKDWGG